MNSLRARIEAAGVTYLKSQLPAGTNVYPGHSTEDDVLPKVVFSVRSMQENPFKSGNFDVGCTIETKWHAAAGSEEDNETLITEVQNATWISDLEAQLMLSATLNGDPLAIFGLTGGLKVDFSINDDIWISTLSIELNGCCVTA